MRPLFITTTRSASSSASSWSWVTKMVVKPVSSCSWRSQRRSSMRTLASSAPNGSSSSSTVGSIAIARASATRWRWPPDNCPGRRSRKLGHLHQLQQRVHARWRCRPCSAASCAAASAGRRRCSRTRSCAGTARNAGTRSRPCARAGSAGSRRCRRRRCGRYRPCSSPAIRRSSVVLPEPEGPSSATSWPEGIARSSGLTAGMPVEALAGAFDANFHGSPFSGRRACRRGLRHDAVPARVSGPA